MTPVEFLMRVWGWNAKTGQYVFLCTKSTSGQWREHAFKYGSSLKEELEDFFDRDRGNVYFCPNAFLRPRRHNSVCAPTRFLWADLDSVRAGVCDPKPTVGILSSPDRYAALWHLDHRLDPTPAAETNRSLTYSLGADKGGWDLTQVLRVPGTKNYKYDDAPRVKLLWWNDRPIAPPDNSADAERIYAKYKNKMSASLKQKVKAKSVIVGQRSSMLWFLENELISIGMKPQEIITLLKNTSWNKYKGRRDEDERFTTEIMKIFQKQGDAEDDVEQPVESDRRAEKYAGAIIRLSDVAPEAVEWVWYPYIPRGKLTIVEGDPSMGKSWITFAIAAHLSRRRRFPNQDKPVSGRVLLLSAEDGMADTVRPRLNSLDADSRKVFAYVKPITLDDDGIQELEAQIIELRPLVVLLDPLVAYMGGSIDLHKANEVREFTARLADVAERYRCAIIGVRHLTKSSRDKSIYRGIGSIDLTAAARSVLHVGQDPEDESCRVIAHIKSNLASAGPSIRYMLRSASAKPFKWMGTTRLRAVDLVQADKDVKTEEQSIAHAEKFLKTALAKAPRIVADVVRDAEAKGISKGILNKARERLPVEATKHESQWQWKLGKESKAP